MRFIVLIAALAASAVALAQYPAKPITTVVGFEPGGGTDTTARIVAPALGELLGQQVVVENRAGAGGNIAVDYVAKQVPDGYTIVLANVGALAVNPHILKTPYDPLKDLAPISMASVFPNVLVVQPSLPVTTVQDYVKLAKEKPGITYASSGIGGAGHLAGELLRLMAKIDITHVPYKGGGPAMQGFLGGQVDSFFATPVSSIGQIRAGKARAKTPKDIVNRLARDIAKALAHPQVVGALNKTGVEPLAMTPEEFGRYIEREYQTWGKVVKDAHIKAE